MTHGLIRVETPREYVDFAARRAGPIVMAELAIHGSVQSAAASAYLQGVRDAVESIERTGWPPPEPKP